MGHFWLDVVGEKMAGERRVEGGGGLGKVDDGCIGPEVEGVGGSDY